MVEKPVVVAKVLSPEVTVLTRAWVVTAEAEASSDVKMPIAPVDEAPAAALEALAAALEALATTDETAPDQL